MIASLILVVLLVLNKVLFETNKIFTKTECLEHFEELMMFPLHGKLLE